MCTAARLHLYGNTFEEVQGAGLPEVRRRKAPQSKLFEDFSKLDTGLSSM